MELKIFDKEIQPELIVMEQEKYAAQEAQLKSRFIPNQESVRSQISLLKDESIAKSLKRDDLLRFAQEEADGTGGSKRRNLGPIYKVKKADADKVDKELIELTLLNQQRINALEKLHSSSNQTMNAELTALSFTSRKF